MISNDITLTPAEAEAVGESLALLRRLLPHGERRTARVMHELTLDVENALRGADTLEREPNPQLVLRTAFEKFGIRLPLTTFD